MVCPSSVMGRYRTGPDNGGVATGGSTGLTSPRGSSKQESSVDENPSDSAVGAAQSEGANTACGRSLQSQTMCSRLRRDSEDSWYSDRSCLVALRWRGYHPLIAFGGHVGLRTRCRWRCRGMKQRQFNLAALAVLVLVAGSAFGASSTQPSSTQPSGTQPSVGSQPIATASRATAVRNIQVAARTAPAAQPAAPPTATSSFDPFNINDLRRATARLSPTDRRDIIVAILKVKNLQHKKPKPPRTPHRPDRDDDDHQGDDDDRGHGNDPDREDDDNPGQGNADGRR